MKKVEIGTMIEVMEYRGAEQVKVQLEVEYDFQVEGFQEYLEDGYDFQEALERFVWIYFDYCEMDAYEGQEDWSHEVIGII